MANRQVTPLTDTTIKNAKIKDKDYTLPDGNGLQLLIKASGSKLWEIRYTLNGKPKKTTAGNYPETSLAEARKKRDELKQSVAEGINPIEIKKEIRKQEELVRAIEVNTFEKVSRDFFATIEKRTDEKYYSLKFARLQNHVFPHIGHLPINDIKRSMIVECLDLIVQKGQAETARRVHNIISQVYRYAVTRELTPHNITTDIDKQYVIGKKVENHFPTITDHKEVSKLLKAIEEYHGEETVRLALKFAYITAQRPFNIRFAEWTEFNLETNEWSIPAEKMKMKRPHVVPISPQLRDILARLEPYTKHRSIYLFPSMTSNTRPISENTLNQALRRLGYSKEEIVSHGFRAMFSTISNELIPEHGFHTDVIERHLAHKETNKIKGAYNHAEYLKERHGLALWWGNFCDQLKNEVK